MAVYKSRRKDAAAQFVADARELRKATVRIARKFPASYKYVTTGPLLQLASEVYMNALKGNSIYVHKDMSERDYELRHRYLAAATASADALLGEIDHPRHGSGSLPEPRPAGAGAHQPL